MKAYLDDTVLKDKFIEQIKWHADQDKIIQGTYGDSTSDNFKGCAVGCSIHSLGILEGKTFKTSEHKLYESELGIPEWLARLEDTIFEGLPVQDAKQWPLRFSQAIQVGADLEPVKWQFCAYLMKENIDRVLALEIDNSLKEQVVSAIRQVLAVHSNAIETGVWDESAARSARSAAESAAESAARSAAYLKHAAELIRLLEECA